MASDSKNTSGHFTGSLFHMPTYERVLAMRREVETTPLKRHFHIRVARVLAVRNACGNDALIRLLVRI